jgi:hypothetical protein
MEKNEEKQEDELRKGWELWEEWDKERKITRMRIKEDKKEYVKTCIKEIGTPEGPDNIWKAIDKIAPKSYKNNRTLEKENGEICNDIKEEKEAVKQFCEKHLQQREYDAERSRQEDGEETKWDI